MIRISPAGFVAPAEISPRVEKWKDARAIQNGPIFLRFGNSGDGS
ncbi:hypothetical protein CSIRO_0522 [Bradyrhizobiaceae bacterium SG-6C]|nr:hypothetical protein CSIRO_0522 [Bradyrhizobiaceae bacterium SG-6C]